MGWKDDPIVSDAPSTGTPGLVAGAAPSPDPRGMDADPVVKEAPSILDRTGRQVGLFGRSLVTGAASIPAIGADALGAILNLGIDAYNKMNQPSLSDLVKGKKYTPIPRFEPQLPALERNLTAAGLPSPQTPTERIVYKTNQALTGQGGVIKAGEQMVKAAAPGASEIGSILAAQPGAQMTAAGGAGLAGAVANESGASPLMEFIAALTGGVFAPSAVSVVKGIPGLVEPFTASGQRNIAGNVLASAASTPVATAAALRAAESMVPGVRQTMAAASRDPGLASLERTLSAKPAGSVIQDQYLQNNAARVAELDDLAGTAGDITRAENARSVATKGSRESALGGALIGSPSDAVVANIDNTLKSAKGNRQVVNDALTWARNRIQGVTEPDRLYEIRKDINDAMNGKLAGDKSVYRLASSELMKIRDQLDDVIESDAPGFKAYLQQYKDASKPINQMEVLQEIRKRALGTQEDRLGNRNVLPSGLQRTMDTLDEVAASATGMKNASAESILTPQQLTRLESLRKDVADAAFSQSGGKVAGSNTVQLANYSTANIIGRIAKGDTGPITRNVARGLDWLNKLNDRDIDRLLIEAAKDPALAGTLMKEASPDRIKLASDGLEQLARSIGIGTATSGSILLSGNTAEAKASIERLRKAQESKPR